MQHVKRAHKKTIAAVFLMVFLSMFMSGCMNMLLLKQDNHEYTYIISAKQLFDAVNDALYKFEDTIYVQTDSYDEFMKFWNELDSEFALHSAFREKDVKLSYTEKDTVCKLKINMTYNACGQAMKYLYAKNVDKYPTAEAEEVGKALLEIKNSIITEGMRDEEKVMKIHDYLISHCEYAVDGDIDHYATAYVLLNEKKAQCQGYSEAFAALCLLSGIPCKIISGTSTFAYGDGAHAWCLVKVNATWYHVDVTWDDPIPDVPSMIRYDFYLKGDTMMKSTHSWCSYYEACYIDYAS